MSELGLDIDGLNDVEVQNTSIDEIDSENINLMFLGVDRSTSMNPYTVEMAGCLVDFKSALEDSKEADEILVARADFSDRVSIGGYKRINEFDTTYDAYGSTALYDTIVEGSEKLIEYMKVLRNEGMRVKAVFSIFSDGQDVGSHRTYAEAKKAVDLLNKEEIVTSFISFGPNTGSIPADLGFINKLNVGSSASELRRAFSCLSKSVIENSKSVVNKTDDFFEV